MLKKGHLPQNDVSTALHVIILVLAVMAILVPFSDKPFHADDPMFLWAAKHIQTDPINFYGFNVNWLNLKTSMPDAMKNPPLASYYIALAAWAFGWAERYIHLAMTLPAAAVGMYFIARRITRRPLLAALIGVLTPAFVVSGTTVMSDIMMLAFWCWAVVLWMRGVEKDDPLSLTAAALLVAMSALTKYFGMSLIPLLAAYSIFDKKGPSRHLAFLIIPVVILAGYQWATHEMYGKGLLFDAADYAVSARYKGGLTGNIQSGFIGLVFVGGCVITGLLYMPFLWPARTVLLWASLAVAVAATLIIKANNIGVTPIIESGRPRWDVVIQVSLFAVAGVSIMALSAVDFFRRRDAASFLLVLWVAGTFVFAAFLNWTVSGRAVLPIAPAAGMIFARRMDDKNDGRTAPLLKLYSPLIPALVIAITVAWADYDFAKAGRSAAYYVYGKYSDKTDHIWFQGHWGFQYYIESIGGKAVAIDWHDSHISRGDIVVFSTNHYRPGRVRPLIPTIEALRLTPSGHPATVGAESHAKTSAGFYSSTCSALPYFLGPQSEDVYLIKYATADGDLRLPFDPGTKAIHIPATWTTVFGDDV